jgi:hypothetical protein
MCVHLFASTVLAREMSPGLLKILQRSLLQNAAEQHFEIFEIKLKLKEETKPIVGIKKKNVFKY